jgi:hypothetical protein|tara:strand:+ start:1668 stop:1916 length:249 start_codon:yes stop_codon:yes gene_type:complete
MAKNRKSKKNFGEPFPVTTARVPPLTPPAAAIPTENGTKVGYRDVGNNIEYKVFESAIEKGWFDSPAKCKNEYDPGKLIDAK